MRGLTGLLSPTHNNHKLIYQKKNDEGERSRKRFIKACLKADDIFILVIAHGSQISLMSGGSSMYGSTTEEQRQANEVRRLKRELSEAREQVMSLSSQLSTNVSTRSSSYNNDNSPVIDFSIELCCCHVFIE
jgi:predicted  nucleic acid-binding Zn-ribbon protein